MGLLTRVAGCRVPGHMLSYRSARLETARVDADRLWLNSMSDPNALHSASAASDLTENTFSSVERDTRWRIPRLTAFSDQSERVMLCKRCLGSAVEYTYFFERDTR